MEALENSYEDKIRLRFHIDYDGISVPSLYILNSGESGTFIIENLDQLAEIRKMLDEAESHLKSGN